MDEFVMFESILTRSNTIGPKDAPGCRVVGTCSLPESPDVEINRSFTSGACVAFS